MLNFRFRVRSAQRDVDTDERRLAKVKQVLHSAVIDVESELVGLKGRQEDARRMAALLLGSMQLGESSKAQDRRLSNAEENLLAAERRIAQLNDHLAALRRIENAVDKELVS